MKDMQRIIICFKTVGYGSLLLSFGYLFICFIILLGGDRAFGDMTLPEISIRRTVLHLIQLSIGGYFAFIVTYLEKKVKYKSCIKAALFMVICAPPMGIYCYLKLKKTELKKIFDNNSKNG